MSGCSCVWVDASDDQPEVVREAIRAAAKPHVCGECGGTIQQGEKYEYITGLWDGDWSTFKTCLSCVRIRKDHFCEGWIFERVREDFFNACGFDYCGEWEGDNEEGQQ